VDRIRSRLVAELSELFVGVNEWDLVDFPHHFNCGDSAIWLGELELARQLAINIRSTTTLRTYRRERLKGSGPIVIHGGGNFGGLYPHHDELRIRVLTDWPDRRVVQLPQSIELANEEMLQRLKRAIDNHNDFTLLARDQRSLDIAVREFACRTVLVPDAAFALTDLARRPPRRPLVVQTRDDHEAASDQMTDVPTVDWTTARGISRRTVAWQAVEIGGNVDWPYVYSAAANWFARENVAWAVKVLSDGQLLATDRLHGHIIALLCSIEHIVVNDRHGKVEAFWDTWTHEDPIATFAPTWTEARPLIRSRLASQTAG
jgi:pyruvyl transferase EpsO